MRKLFSENFWLSLEDTLISVTSQEKEIALYCKLSNPKGLTEAAYSELHYQYMGSFTEGDKCRVREVIPNQGNKVHTFTIKTKADEEDQFNSCVETSLTVDEHFTNVFKNNASLHVQKIRYVFHGDAVKLSFKEGDAIREIKLPDVKYEIDVFTTKNNEDSPWVKIDIEMTAIIDFISKNHPDLKNINLTIKVSHLPIGPTDVIIDFSANEQQKKFISSLWQTEYNRK